ncbi:GAF domain-containing sensor histidine kinase [Mobiluncus porci]|uniref:GAF domain-containing protein n=2 Tax=Actinomycetaceae TaxID=2049 RepID=A0A7K0K558_9ACTO|nr:histidine kinase [Mobiluncus porci]MST50612.1 GAF domain-containing protein [Mobiluncus porci]
MSQRITTALLEDTEEEDALRLICQSVLEVAEADTVLIVLPSLGEKYICEIADGEAARDVIGLEFPPEGRAQSVIRSNVGMIVPSMERAHSLRVPQLSRFGPALYAPMSAHGVATGVIIVFRNPGRDEFTQPALQAAEDLAAQATLALRLAAIRHAEDRASLLEERQRIARDLHDLAIQQLFATSLQLGTIKDDLIAGVATPEKITESIDQALAAVGDSVSQIRQIVSGLKESDSPAFNLVDGLWHETSLARRSLGFAPSLVLALNNEVFSKDNSERLDSELVEILDENEIADALAVVREGLTNVARHAHATEVLVEVQIWAESGLVPPGCGHIEPTVPLKSETNGLMWVEITDDGTGLEKTVGRHSGLANMAARASVHFGYMNIENRPDSTRGTKLTWCIPLSV